MSLRFAEAPVSLDLAGAAVTVLHDSEATWPKTLDLQGCTYTRLEAAEDVFDGSTRRGKLAWFWRRVSNATPADVPRRLRWLRLASIGDAPQPYTQLMAFYRREGRDGDARRVAYERERWRSQQLGFPRNAWTGFLRWTVGYGYRPFGALLWLGLLLAFGTLLFSSLHSQGQIPSLEGDHPPFVASIYTLDRLIPVVSFGLRERVCPPRGGAMVGIRLHVARVGADGCSAWWSQCGCATRVTLPARQQIGAIRGSAARVYPRRPRRWRAGRRRRSADDGRRNRRGDVAHAEVALDVEVDDTQSVHDELVDLDAAESRLSDGEPLDHGAADREAADRDGTERERADGERTGGARAARLHGGRGRGGGPRGGRRRGGGGSSWSRRYPAPPPRTRRPREGPRIRRSHRQADSRSSAARPRGQAPGCASVLRIRLLDTAALAEALREVAHPQLLEHPARPRAARPERPARRPRRQPLA